jgi:hypothetical protein
MDDPLAKEIIIQLQLFFFEWDSQNLLSQIYEKITNMSFVNLTISFSKFSLHVLKS